MKRLEGKEKVMIYVFEIRNNFLKNFFTDKQEYPTCDTAGSDHIRLGVGIVVLIKHESDNYSKLYGFVQSCLQITLPQKYNAFYFTITKSPLYSTKLHDPHRTVLLHQPASAKGKK